MVFDTEGTCSKPERCESKYREQSLLWVFLNIKNILLSLKCETKSQQEKEPPKKQKQNVLEMINLRFLKP